MAESVADTWEDLDDSGELDKKLDKLVLQTSQSADELKGAPSNSITMPCLQEEFPGRTTYQPTVRILKRETNAAMTASNNVAVPRQPTRTLQEREAAYAEARLRILGSAVPDYDDDSDVDDENRSISANGLPRPSSSAEKPSSNSADFPVANKDKTVDVLRQPFGPDGSRGFSVTR